MFSAFQRGKKLQALQVTKTANLRTDANLAQVERLEKEKKEGKDCDCPACTLSKILRISAVPLNAEAVQGLMAGMNDRKSYH